MSNLKLKNWQANDTTRPHVFRASAGVDNDALVVLLRPTTPFHLFAACAAGRGGRGYPFGYSWGNQLTANHYAPKGYSCVSQRVALPREEFDDLSPIHQPPNSWPTNDDGLLIMPLARLVPTAQPLALAKGPGRPDVVRAVIDAQILEYGIDVIRDAYADYADILSMHDLPPLSATDDTPTKPATDDTPTKPARGKPRTRRARKPASKPASK